MMRQAVWSLAITVYHIVHTMASEFFRLINQREKRKAKLKISPDQVTDVRKAPLNV